MGTTITTMVIEKTIRAISDKLEYQDYPNREAATEIFDELKDCLVKHPGGLKPENLAELLINRSVKEKANYEEIDNQVLKYQSSSEHWMRACQEWLDKAMKYRAVIAVLTTLCIALAGTILMIL